MHRKKWRERRLMDKPVWSAGVGTMQTHHHPPWFLLHSDTFMNIFPFTNRLSDGCRCWSSSIRLSIRYNQPESSDWFVSSSTSSRIQRNVPPPSFNGTFSSFTLTHQLQINFITWLNRKQCTAAPAHFKRWVAYLTTRFFLTSKYLSLRPSLVKYGSKSLNF